VLPANVRLDWKVIARYKHSSLFGLVFSNERKKSFITLTPGGWTFRRRKGTQEKFSTSGNFCIVGLTLKHSGQNVAHSAKLFIVCFEMNFKN
jgi:hypothetical protein